MRDNHDDVLPWPVARKRAYEHAGRGLEIDPEAPLPADMLCERIDALSLGRSAAHYRLSKPSDEDDLASFHFLPVE